MSNLFDVMKKTNVRYFADICEAPTEVLNGSLPTEVLETAPIPIPRPPQRANRIVRLKVSASGPLFPFEDIRHAAAEQYRMIRTKILHSNRRPHLLVVSSPCSGDGKTVTSINIAASLALKKDFSVLLVDADLRRPRIAKELGIPDAPGLADVLSGRIPVDDALVEAEQFPSLSILTAGNVSANPAELLDSDRCRNVVQDLRSRFDLVLFDTTPADTVADYELLQELCDAMVVVIRPGRTNRRASTKILSTVPKEKLLGIVLNGVEDWLFWHTPAYQYYSSLPPDEGKG